MTVRQKVPKSYFQSQFWISKINQIFSKNKFIQEYQFRRPLFIKNFFFSIFEPLYFLKLRPIFDGLTFLAGSLFHFFLGGMLILGQKSYFFGPTILKIPQPN